MTLTSVSLFSGVGGLDLGLHRAGIEPVLLCEFDDYKRRVLAAHWPEVPIHDDVRTLVARLRLAEGRRADGDNEPDAVLPEPWKDEDAGRVRVDVVHGGFPCQDVSVAGKRAGLAGVRTGLFWDALGVIAAIRPRAVLLENVPGLLTSNGGRDFGVVLGELADLGYGVAWRVLDAQHFDVPQRRHRVFVCALLGDDPRAAAERAGAVLAIGESVPRDSAPLGGAGSAVAGDAPRGVDGGRVPGSGDPGTRNGRDVADALTRSIGKATHSSDAMPLVASTLTSHRGKGGGGLSPEETLIPYAPDVAATLSGGGHPNSAIPGRHKEDDVNLVATPGAIAFHATQTPVSGSVVPAMGRKSGGNGVLAFRKSARVNATPNSPESWVDDGRANTLNGFDVGDVRTTHAVVDEATVRRLMPVECERLMGWPDGWTAPPGVKAPDSRRYAACGDGVVAPVAEWIGRRLAAEIERAPA